MQYCTNILIKSDSTLFYVQNILGEPELLPLVIRKLCGLSWQFCQIILFLYFLFLPCNTMIQQVMAFSNRKLKFKLKCAHSAGTV